MQSGAFYPMHRSDATHDVLRSRGQSVAGSAVKRGTFRYLGLVVPGRQKRDMDASMNLPDSRHRGPSLAHRLQQLLQTAIDQMRKTRNGGR